MDALQSVKKILKRQEFFLEVVGFNVFKKNYRPTIRTICVTAYGCLILSVVIWNPYLFRKNLEEFIQTFLVIFYAAKGFYRFYLFLKEYEALAKNNEDSLKIYEKLLESPENEQIFIKYSKIFIKLTNNLTVFYMIFFVSFLLLPAFGYMFTQELELLFIFTLPPSPFGQKLDLLFNCIFQGLGAVIALFFLTGYYTFYVSSILSICFQIDCLRHKLGKLSDTDDYSSLRDIIEWHCEMFRLEIFF